MIVCRREVRLGGLCAECFVASQRHDFVVTLPPKLLLRAGFAPLPKLGEREDVFKDRIDE